MKKVLGRGRTLRWDTRQGELTGEHLVCDERGAHAARTVRRHAPSGRWCGAKIRQMVRTLEIPKPTVVSLEPVRREYITRGTVVRHGPSDECPRCEIGQGSHSEKCTLRFDKVRLQETEFRQAEIPLTPATSATTALATTSASTSVPVATTSNPTLDAQVSATDVSMQATSARSGGIKRPIEATSEMGTSDVGTDVPMSVIDQQPAVGGRLVFSDGSGLDSELPPYVLCHHFRGGGRARRAGGGLWKRLSAGCTTARLPLRSLCEKVLACRKAETEGMMIHHVLDEVLEGEAVGRLSSVQSG